MHILAVAGYIIRCAWKLLIYINAGVGAGPCRRCTKRGPPNRNSWFTYYEVALSVNVPCSQNVVVVVVPSRVAVFNM